MAAEQKIEMLGEDDVQNLDKARNWVKEHFTPDAQHKFSVIAEKLRLLQTILDNEWIKPNETAKLQNLGIVFGDAIAEKMGLLWVMVEDEYGRDPALLVPKTTILAFPLTAISKRVEDGDKVDIYYLFDGFCDLIEKRKMADVRQN